MNLFLVILIAISLSMDAFSLSLAYGTLGINKKDKYLISIITGVFHFFMPILGIFIGNIIFNLIRIDPDILIFIILSFIGIEMIISSFKKEEVKVMKLPEFFLFAFAVSIDSFSVGITFTRSVENVLISPFIFSLTSFIFTYVGLSLGNKIARLAGKLSTIVGGIILIIIGLMKFF